MDKQKHGRPRQSSDDLTYLRKIKKPLVEKRRRERINTSLQQLKQLLIENIKLHGGTQVSKLDKADILELTVSYLRHVQHQQKSVAMATSSSVKQEYVAGYSEAVRETLSFLQSGNSESTHTETYMNRTMNRNTTSATTSLTSIDHVTTSLGSFNGLELLHKVKRETDNSMINTDSNGNFKEGPWAPTSENVEMRTIFASKESMSRDYAASRPSLYTNSVSVTESKHYLNCANTYQRAAIGLDREPLNLPLDLNGNVNNVDDSVNNNYIISNVRENSDRASVVMVNSVNDNANDVCEDVNSDDEVDRLYIHVEDSVSVGDENGNGGNLDNDNAERDDVWRPW